VVTGERSNRATAQQLADQCHTSLPSEVDAMVGLHLAGVYGLLAIAAAIGRLAAATAATTPR
jgi:hypothetical protein